MILTFGVPAESTRRGVAGLQVPWNVPGRPRGYNGDVLFRPGSIAAEDQGAGVLLLDHDETRPVGVPIAAVSDRAGAWASFRLADTRDGHEAAELVDLTARDGLSIGARVWEYEITDAGELVVIRATVRETSLLTFPAYHDARATLTNP